MAEEGWAGMWGTMNVCQSERYLQYTIWIPALVGELAERNQAKKAVTTIR